ncbi:hypothetical protein VTN00DRAFT_624 [Thermoascus crustaceus]|uniref:uncharacterized protein n=1 Tax=Thermoascus crustaceus TaxID=5088 RepID=UPI003743055F
MNRHNTSRYVGGAKPRKGTTATGVKEAKRNQDTAAWGRSRWSCREREAWPPTSQRERWRPGARRVRSRRREWSNEVNQRAGCRRAREIAVGARAAYDDVRSAGDDVMVPSLASRPRATKTTKDVQLAGRVRSGLEPVPALHLLCFTVEMSFRARPALAKRFPRRGPVSKGRVTTKALSSPCHP